MKKVSIIIPVYNGSNYIKEAIESAINQTYKNIEIIVVNDGSNDNGKTKEIVEKYLDKVTYYEKENGGVSTALNLGIEKSTGEYISWLSHDDLYYENKIEKEINELEKYDDKTILYSDVDMIDMNGKKFSTFKYDHDLLTSKPDYAVLRGNISGITLLIPRKAFDDCGMFDVNLRTVQDYAKWFEMMDKYKFVHIKDVLAASRVHPKQVTFSSPRMISEGNVLWTSMVKNYPKKKKIEYEGSVYLFDKEMENFLKSSPYREAEKNIHDLAEEELKEAKEKISNLETTIVIIDNNDKELVEKTKESIEKQTIKNYKLLIEKNINDALNNIKTDYYTIINQGVTLKDDYLESMLIKEVVTNRGVIISDYKRPLRSGIVDNYCSYLVPFDGVFFKKVDDIKYENTYQFILDNAKKTGSFVTEECYLDNIKENYNIDEVMDYLRRVLEYNKSSNYQIACLNYDISVIYNKYRTEDKKVFMYEDSDEFKELKFSRSFRLFSKYYNYKKKKKKTI